MPSTTKPQQAAVHLLERLDDSNVHIRTAAVLALKNTRTPAALPKLKKILDEQLRHGSSGDSDDELNGMAVEAILALGSPEAEQVLADHLNACLKSENPSGEYGPVYRALNAFGSITGQNWIESSDRDEAAIRNKAALALRWWKERPKKTAVTFPRRQSPS